MPLLTVEVVRAAHIMAADRSGKSDPYVFLKLGNQKQETNTIPQTLHPEFNEEFAFHVADPFKQKLDVRLFDRDKYGKSADLGRQNVRLDNLTKGRLQEFSLVMKENGKLIIRVRALDFGNIPEGGDKPLVLAQKRVAVYLIGAEKMVAADSNGLSDPFAKLILGGNKEETKVHYKTLNPVWKEAFVFPVLDPEQQLLRVEVFDKDKTGIDPIGKCTIRINNLFAGYSNDAWVPLLFKNHQTKEWYTPKENSQVHLICCPIGYGKAPPEREKKTEETSDHKERVTKAQEKAWKESEHESTSGNKIEVLVKEALGGSKYSDATSAKVTIRATIRGTSFETDEKYELRHPKWNQTCVFPVDSFRERIYIELLDDGKLLGENTFKPLKITRNWQDVWLVMAYDEESSIYTGDDPRVHISFKGTGPDVGKAVEHTPRKKKEITTTSTGQPQQTPTKPHRDRSPVPPPPAERGISSAEERKKTETERKAFLANRVANDEWEQERVRQKKREEELMKDKLWQLEEKMRQLEVREKNLAEREKALQDRDGKEDPADNGDNGDNGGRRKKRSKKGRRRHHTTDSSSDESSSGDMFDLTYDWRLKMHDVPRTPGEMIWFKVLVYLMTTTKSLAKNEYQMLKVTRDELLTDAQSTSHVEMERTLREWVSKREEHLSNGDQPTLPMLAFGKQIPASLNLASSAPQPQPQQQGMLLPPYPVPPGFNKSPMMQAAPLSQTWSGILNPVPPMGYQMAASSYQRPYAVGNGY